MKPLLITAIIVVVIVAVGIFLLLNTNRGSSPAIIEGYMSSLNVTGSSGLNATDFYGTDEFSIRPGASGIITVQQISGEHSSNATAPGVFCNIGAYKLDQLNSTLANTTVSISLTLLAKPIQYNKTYLSPSSYPIPNSSPSITIQKISYINYTNNFTVAGISLPIPSQLVPKGAISAANYSNFTNNYNPFLILGGVTYPQNVNISIRATSNITRNSNATWTLFYQKTDIYMNASTSAHPGTYLYQLIATNRDCQNAAGTPYALFVLRVI